MKAYVIKNEEGKYYAQYPREMQRCSRGYFTLDITDAVMVLTSAEAQFIKDAIEEDCNIDAECEIIPITICEGDLEEENRVLKKALYSACNYISQIVDKDVNKLSYEWAKHFIQQAKESD